MLELTLLQQYYDQHHQLIFHVLTQMHLLNWTSFYAIFHTVKKYILYYPRLIKDNNCIIIINYTEICLKHLILV